MSKQNLSNLEVLNLLADLKEEYPYLTKCVREMHLANISDIHSLSAEFEYDGTAGIFAQKKDKKQQDKEVSSDDSKSRKQFDTPPKQPTSISDRIKIARDKAMLSQKDRKKQSLKKHKFNEHDL